MNDTIVNADGEASASIFEGAMNMNTPTVAHMLENAVAAAPDNIFLHEGPKSVTFRELDSVTDRLATAFIKEGLHKD